MQSNRKKQLFFACLAMCLLLVGSMAWIASRAIVWARDLPNRISIQIDDDEVANAFGNIMVESIHWGLNHSDPEMQRTTLQSLADWVVREESAVAWVRDEFSEDLREIEARSTDATLKDAASSLLNDIAEAEIDPQPE